MQSVRHIARVVALATVIAGCGPIADTTAPLVPELEALTPLPPVTTSAPAAAVLAPTPTTTSTSAPATTTAPPEFVFSVAPVTEEVVWATWREECPLHFSELSLLTMSYWDFDGEVATGEMVVNTAVVNDAVAAFRGLFEIGFPIERMERVDLYGGDDKAAMRANVTSGFNCRYVDGTDRWSNHAFGLAIDINPLINPWAREDNVLPLEGELYTDREQAIPGMINAGDDIVAVFELIGWSWGGIWQSADYMHFSKPGN